MEYLKLKEVLNKRILLEDEKQMWLRLGFYVPSESRERLNSDRTKYLDMTSMFDNMGNET